MFFFISLDPSCLQFHVYLCMQEQGSDFNSIQCPTSEHIEDENDYFRNDGRYRPFIGGAEDHSHEQRPGADQTLLSKQREKMKEKQRKLELEKERERERERQVQ